MVSECKYNSEEPGLLEIKLKRYAFNEKLMSYIRLYMRQPYSHESKVLLNTLCLTRISNLDFEEICLERY